MKRRKREMEQASMDAASDLLDTDSNATFAMVIWNEYTQYSRSCRHTLMQIT